jgi:hypothetical protein
MTTDARALIAEGKRHDKAMTDGPWYSVKTPFGDGTFVRSKSEDASGVHVADCSAIGSDEYEDYCDESNAAGIAWLRTNLAALLEGYTSALDEIERMRAYLLDLRSAAANVYSERYDPETINEIDAILKGDPCTTTK